MRKISAGLLSSTIAAVVLGVVICLTTVGRMKGQIMNEEKEAVFTPDVSNVNDLTITVVYDKTGRHYKKGKGVMVFINGRKAAVSSSIGRITCPLPE